ncbi:uncharacterized protein RB166_019840 isoform 2-T2 [Leptodactylus fuscus]|uniref:uncharacterized protein LOC142184435 isoform X2 n=1 Tax=Leptodactylus fuscus TaxID=238119 RepID=UPI003F4E67A4
MDVGVKDFEDIAVYFSEEEWGYLGEQQKRLYKEVMMENYKDLCSLGSFYLKPEIISKIERGKEPCVKNRTPYDGESPIAYFIVKADILSKLPEVSHDDDESDCIYLEIDSDSETELDRESYTSDPVGIEDDSLSDCVYSSVPEPHVKPHVGVAAPCKDDRALDCIYVDSEDEADLEDEDEDDDDCSSDCVYVESETRPTREWQIQSSVKSEDRCHEDHEVDGDDGQILPPSDPPKAAHCQPWEHKALNGLDHDRIILEGRVSPVNQTTNKNQDSPNNNLLNVWYVKRVESSSSHSQVLVPGSPGTEQHKDEDSAEEGAEHDQISDLELLCPMCPEIFTNVSKFFEHQKDHEPKTPVCPECGARFSDSFALERHLLLHIEEKIQVCQECGQCFSTRSALEMHIKTHKGDKQWPCPDCGKFLYSKSGLERHQLIHVRDKPVPCPQCGKCFTKQSNFEMHLRLHAGEEFYSCTECEKLFSTKAACERHIKAHTMERPHGCPECGKRFLYNGCLVKHMRVHTGEKPFVCPECGKGFAQSSSLNCHRRLHEDEKPFVCPECKKCFSKKFNFDTHLKIHAKDKLLSEIAQMKGQNLSGPVSSVLNTKGLDLDLSSGEKPDVDDLSHVSLQNGQYEGSPLKKSAVVDVSLEDSPLYKRPVRHGSLNGKALEGISENHDVAINGGPIRLAPESPVRGIPYNGRPLLDVPFNGRSVEDVFYKTDVSLNNWPIEDLSFIEDSFLEISSNEQSIGGNSFLVSPPSNVYYKEKDMIDLSLINRPNRDISFTKRPGYNVSFYKNPINSKGDEKQHVCPECGKSFPYNGCLVKHLRTHTGEKPYACTECGKCFAQTSTLNCHKRTHTGERPYICPQCGKGFTSQSHVVRHQAIHNVSRSFLCNGCGKEFSQRSYLLKHQKRTSCSRLL